MTSKKPPEPQLEDLIGEKMIQNLDQWEGQNRQYYLTLRNPNLPLFERLLHLHVRLILSTAQKVSGFVPKCVELGPVSWVVLYSAVGSFRNLRVAHKLLLDGYYPEMHNILRMAEQWLECAVVVEVYPEIAKQVLEHGMQKRYIGRYLDQLKTSNTESGELYRAMQKTFHTLSQRAHPLPTAFRLMTREDTGNIGLILSGVLSEEMFARDASYLTNMAKNALVVLKRHFQEVPVEWNAEFREILQRMKQGDAVPEKAG